MRQAEFIELAREAALGPHASACGPDGAVEWERMWAAMAPLEGLATHRSRVIATRGGAVTFLRWQALMLDGSWDLRELSDLARHFRRVDLM